MARLGVDHVLAWSSTLYPTLSHVLPRVSGEVSCYFATLSEYKVPHPSLFRLIRLSRTAFISAAFACL